jgi:hypothetical protein
VGAHGIPTGLVRRRRSLVRGRRGLVRGGAHGIPTGLVRRRGLVRGRRGLVHELTEEEAYVSIRQHTSAYTVKHTSVSIEC